MRADPSNAAIAAVRAGPIAPSAPLDGYLSTSVAQKPRDVELFHSSIWLGPSHESADQSARLHPLRFVPLPACDKNLDVH